MSGNKQDVRSFPGRLPLFYKGRKLPCRKGKYIRNRCSSGRNRDRYGIRGSGKLNELMKESVLTAGDFTASVFHLPGGRNRIPFNVHGIDRLGRIQSECCSRIKMLCGVIVIIQKSRTVTSVRRVDRHFQLRCLSLKRKEAQT